MHDSARKRAVTMVMASLRPFILPIVTRRDLICKHGSRSQLLDHSQALQRTLADRSRTGHIRPVLSNVEGGGGGRVRNVGEFAGRTESNEALDSE